MSSLLAHLGMKRRVLRYSYQDGWYSKLITGS